MAKITFLFLFFVFFIALCSCGCIQQETPDWTLLEGTYPGASGDSITIKEEASQAQMQKDRDDYKSEQNIFNNAQLDTIVTNINAGLEV